ncbi:iron chaperone [Geosporobacter ferrireducens]|uniref:iron chaperone n=1 Tax=Geosporobacter ferrireducens TaxID=1424294 RepID=UPI00139EB09E|nr:DUF1801 domain-containing protein [Geosporobacter ferrireducens]MTI58186.1 hypothetical protein [Geosporobacter ferrireducens]
MEGNKQVFRSIDEYILQFSPAVQEKLNGLRKLIKESAPDAEEKISWQMPTFVFHGNLVHFAAHKKHIGFYPGASGIDAFKDKLSQYKGSKGAVQFPLDEPLSDELIKEIVRFRVAENKTEAEKKLKKKK